MDSGYSCFLPCQNFRSKDLQNLTFYLNGKGVENTEGNNKTNLEKLSSAHALS